MIIIITLILKTNSYCDNTDLIMLKQFAEARGHVVERTHHPDERVVDCLV